MMSDENGMDPEAKVDAERRAALMAMGKTVAYAAPVIATFAMGGLSVQSAYAYGGNLR